jgi:glutamate mutase epsilon subunit
LTGLFGKRSAEIQRILLTDLTSQVIQPAIDSAVQSLAGMLAQITLSVGKFLFAFC